MKIDSTRLLLYQKQARFTGRKLAELSGITANRLSQIKREESTSIVTARCIARALGVPLEEIQKKEEEQK